jgi:hypothetical protein
VHNAFFQKKKKTLLFARTVITAGSKRVRAAAFQNSCCFLNYSKLLMLNRAKEAPFMEVKAAAYEKVRAAAIVKFRAAANLKVRATADLKVRAAATLRAGKGANMTVRAVVVNLKVRAAAIKSLSRCKYKGQSSC